MYGVKSQQVSKGGRAEDGREWLESEEG